MRCRGWRSSRPGTGCRRNGRTAPSGSAMSSARSRARSAAPGSPSASRAVASSSSASTHRDPVEHGSGAVDDGCEGEGRRARVAAGEPQRRHGDAHLAGLPLVLAEFGQGLLGLPGLRPSAPGFAAAMRAAARLADAVRRAAPPAARRRGRRQARPSHGRARARTAPGPSAAAAPQRAPLPLLRCARRAGSTALPPRAVPARPARRPAPGRRRRRAGRRSSRAAWPVRSPACSGSRTSANDRAISALAQWTRLANSRYGRPICCGQRPGLFEMPLCLLESSRPELGGAEPEQRHRAQFLAQPHLRRGQGRRRLEQPPRLLDRAGRSLRS